MDVTPQGKRGSFSFLSALLHLPPSLELTLQPWGLCLTRLHAEPLSNNQNTVRAGGAVNPLLIYL